MTEVHGDVFSHHASTLDVYVFVAVDERGEHIMFDKICRRATENRKEGGVAIEVCSSQTCSRFCTLGDIFARIRTSY